MSRESIQILSTRRGGDSSYAAVFMLPHYAKAHLAPAIG
jgi:hypothetical protein